MLTFCVPLLHVEVILVFLKEIINTLVKVTLPVVTISLRPVARGFIARRRVQKRRFEAEKQGKKVNEFLAQISGLSVTYHDAQVKKISDDAEIPKGK